MLNGQTGNRQNPDLEYFVIFDSKVGVYREPMLAINRHDMLRQIDQIMRDPQNKLNQLVANAEDFALFKIGEYDKMKGVITTTQHEHIANLHDIRSAVQRRMLAEQPEIPLQVGH